MSLIIGLTGPTGAGKSSVSKVAENLGFKIIDCDLLARKATEKGTQCLNDLTTAFGEEILNSDGTLNRKRLAQIAFSSEQKTELLNKTVLPFIADMVIKEAVGKRILLDAPTLFESGINRICKATVAVLADSQVRLDRIIKRDNITQNDAKLRISAGKSDEFYIQNANYIIYNNNENFEFIDEFKKILIDIVKKES